MLRVFNVLKTTTGKVQRAPFTDIFIFAALARARSVDEFWKTIERLAGEDPGFRAFVGKKWPRRTPADTRNAFTTVFSISQRGAGSGLASFPLVTLGASERPIEITHRPELDREYEGAHGDRIRLAPYHIHIGHPYELGLCWATQVVAKAVDRVAAGVPGDPSDDIEGLTAGVVRELPELLSARDRTGGRPFLQMDFFTLLDAVGRRRLLTEGPTEEIVREIRAIQDQGGLRLAIFDVSGGLGGVGASDVIARQWDRASENTGRVVTGLVAECQQKAGAAPEVVLIVPREEDLSIRSVEYDPMAAEFAAQGFEAHIATAQQVEAALGGCEGGEMVGVQNVAGEMVRLGGRKVLVVKRFTFLGEGAMTATSGNGVGQPTRGRIVGWPASFTVLCPPASRIVASDKRVNLRILDLLAGDLGKHGIDVIPTLFLSLADTTAAAYAAAGWLASIAEQWPEAGLLGGVVKTHDKVPGRPGVGELVSAYPLPAAPTPREVVEIISRPLLDGIKAKGVTEVVVMPNVIPTLAWDGGLLAKTELKMMAFAEHR